MIELDAEESRFLRAYMHEQENLPPEVMERKRRFLEQCAAFAIYCETFGRFPDWEIRPELYDNAEPERWRS